MLAIACLCANTPAAELAPWLIVQNGRFEVYSHSEAAARGALGRLERLRVLAAERMGWGLASAHRVRVIGFGSEDEYLAYRPQPVSDGFYAGSESRDYIALPGLGDEHAGALAHEYAHVLMHSSGLNPPTWLNEGLAMVFSAEATGREVAARLQLLRRRPWLPFSEIVVAGNDAQLLGNRESAEVFYAECWALTETLIHAPDYAPRFTRLMVSIGTGAAGAKALETVYGKPLEAIETDARAWIGRLPREPAPAPETLAADTAAETRPLTAFAMGLVLGDLLLTSRQPDRAEALFGQLAREAPDRPEPYAGLGAAAMAGGRAEDARRWWKRSLELGLADGDICYRYAALLDGAGVSGTELRDALKRTLELRPDFDEARWQLALLEENEGHEAVSLDLLRAMKTVPPERAHAYWCAVADAQLGLGRNEEAAQAAVKALAFATTLAERQRALRIQYMAQTHLAVQLRTDSAGHQEMVTTRVPNDAADWNPFVEPDDQMRRASGVLEQVDCAPGGIQVTVRVAAGRLRLEIPDPGHVRILHGPTEFTCGAQSPAKVIVDYAALKSGHTDGVVRGMDFQH
jgi:tetratricopeptide (TPR) repeat protein